jgi:hypothetical protein
MKTRTFLAGAAAALAITIPAATAEAKTYCVAKPECVAAGNADMGDDLQAALEAAQKSIDPDRVEVGPGTFAGPFTYGNASSRLLLVGAGRGATKLTMPGAAFANWVLALQSPALAHDLSIEAPAGTNKGGLLLTNSAEAEHVDVSGAGTANAYGALLEGGRFADGSIDMGDDPGNGGILTGAGLNLVDRARVIAGTGIVEGGSPGTKAIVRRSRVIASETGVWAQGGRTDLYSTLIDVRAGVTGIRVANWNAYNGQLGSVISQVTLVGSGKPGSVGVYVSADTATEDVDAWVFDSVVTGFASPVRRLTSAGSASIVLSSSVYGEIAPADSIGTGSIGQADPLGPVVEFADAAAGDFRLRAASPLVDAGSDAPLQNNEPEEDLAGAARLVDGDGDGVVRRDPGAFEAPAPKQAVAPQAAPPATPATAPAASLDSTAPVLSGLKAKWSRRRAVLRMALSEPATLRLRVQRRSGGKWVAVGKARTLARGAGATTVRLKLAAARPGKHRIVVRAVDAAGNRSAAARPTFRIAR